MMLVLLVPLKTTRTSIVPRLWALGFSMVAEVLQLILWTMAMSVYAACETVWLLVEMVDGWASYHVLTADARLLHARARLARAQRAKLLAEHGDFPQEARFVNALRGPLNSEATPTQRASGRLARATSALRALLEHTARLAEETRRQEAEEEARACARRLQRANAIWHWRSVSAGRKLFWIFMTLLATTPEWPTATESEALSFSGLQWQQLAATKQHHTVSVNHAVDLLLEYGEGGLQSLYSSGTVSFNLSVLDPDAALFQVDDVPLNETVKSMQQVGAFMLGVSVDQISLVNTNSTPINPVQTLASLLVNGTVALHVLPRDRVGSDRGECSGTATADPMDILPAYPRHPGRRRVEEQPGPKEYPSQHPSQRWKCRAIVEQEGTGKAKAGTWYRKFQDFTGTTCADVVQQREAWISSYLHPKPKGEVTGERFAPTTERAERVKRVATPTSMAEVRGAQGPSAEQARPGPGRGHTDEPGAWTKLEEPVLIEKLKAGANWFEQAAQRQVRVACVIHTWCVWCVWCVWRVWRA